MFEVMCCVVGVLVVGCWAFVVLFVVCVRVLCVVYLLLLAVCVVC